MRNACLSHALLLTVCSCSSPVKRYTVELVSLLPGEPALVATSRSSPGERKVKAVDPVGERGCRRRGRGGGGRKWEMRGERSGQDRYFPN